MTSAVVTVHPIATVDGGALGDAPGPLTQLERSTCGGSTRRSTPIPDVAGGGPPGRSPIATNTVC